MNELPKLWTVLIAVVVIGIAASSVGLMTGGSDDMPLDPPRSEPTARVAAEQTSYGTEMEVEASIDGPLEAALTVTGLSARDAQDGGLDLIGDAAVIVTSQAAVEVALDEVISDREVTATTSRLEGSDIVVERRTTRLQPDAPIVVMLQVEAVSVPTGDGMPRSVPFTEELAVTIPVRAVDGGQADVIEVDLVPRELTAEDLGVPEPADMPDQQLPRPQAGQALPEQLQDGTPVWVVGLDDDVVVLDARSPHAVSGLVGWCGTLPGFIDSPGAALFDSRGTYRFGPAPTGLIPYEIELGTDTVTVLSRLAAPPRPEIHAPLEDSDFPQGDICRPLEPEGDGAPGGGYREDYTDAPGWIQHDLSGWADFDGQADGWFRTDDAELDGGGRQTGDLLIRRQDGRTVDIASPPGASTPVPDPDPDPTVVLLVTIEPGPSPACPTCAHGSVSFHDVVWVTPDEVAVARPGPGPALPRSLVPAHLSDETPGHHRPLAPDATIGASPGDLVVFQSAQDLQVLVVTRA